MEIAAAKAGKSTKVLSQKMATEMLTVQKAPSGLGPMLHGSGHAFYFEHGGSNEGYRCEVMYFPEIGRGAAVMTNSDAGSAVAQEVLYALAAEYHWPEYAPREIERVTLDSATVHAMLGSYTIPGALVGRAMAGALVVSQDGGKLYAEATDVFSKAEVVPLSQTKLLAPSTGIELTLIPGPKGGVTAMEIGGMRLPKKGGK